MSTEIIVEESETIEAPAGSRATEAEKPAATAGTDTEQMSATDFVRQRREEIRAKAAPAKAGDAKPEDKTTKPAEGSAELYSDEEWDEIIAEGKSLLNVDLKRVDPKLRATVTKMQTAERKRNERLSTKEQELESRLKRLEAATAVPPKKAAPEDDNDEDALPDAEYDAIFKTRKGKAKLAAAVKDLYGVDPEDLKAMKDGRTADTAEKAITSAVNGAIFMAQKSHPEMKDDAFFDRVIEAIDADEEWTKAFEANRTNAAIMATVFKAAALDIKLKDTMKKADDVKKGIDTIKREKERQNAKPGSQAAKATPVSRPTADMSTADFVRQRRAQLRGQA